jgi:hypothetical protein
MRGRVYDPALRRFITPDPHVTDPLDGQSYNRYSYVANDPVNRTDPTGFDWWDGSLGCIGMECLGGPGYISGGFGFGLSFSFGSGGATANAGTGGTSMPRFERGAGAGRGVPGGERADRAERARDGGGRAGGAGVAEPERARFLPASIMDGWAPRLMSFQSMVVL